ncbi:MAG: hypothetical protein LC799_05610 [Actinobacteria bacterium]|nr:hypothetical protein [Actinomycetota bacterium]
MPTDFTTFMDTPIAVGGVAAPTEVHFRTPNVDQGENCNLSFCVIPAASLADTVTLRVEINTNFILDEQFTSDVQRVWHENFSGIILSPSLRNTLTLTQTGGTGNVSVSDVKVDFKT